jgi:Rrf2 family protein
MLSKSCTYGIQAMLYLVSREQAGYVPIRQISDGLGLSYSFLTKVLQTLTRCDLLRSLRGPKGGVTLNKAPEQIMLADLIEALDGRALFDACLLGNAACDASRSCLLHTQWAPIRRDMQTVFTETSLRDIILPLHPGIGPTGIRHQQAVLPWAFLRQNTPNSQINPRKP